MSNHSFEKFVKECEEIGISLTKRQVCQFSDYYDCLIEWNEKINLTSITDFDEVCTKHFIDSLMFIKMFESYDDMVSMTFDKSLSDVGTGAGFPGIVLKILLPDLNITLMDSLNKRVLFLNEVISKLNLEKICAVHGRVEDLAHDAMYREKFDFVVARAVAGLPVLCEYCLPFVKKGGSFIAFKSERTGEEVKSAENAMKILGGKLSRVCEFTLPNTDYLRTLVRVDKCLNTAKTYPRKAGTPSKKPL